MNRIDEYIDVYLITKDQQSKKIALEELTNYYNKYINAHIEYLEKDLYKEIPLLADFRRRMNAIIQIINANEIKT